MHIVCLPSVMNCTLYIVILLLYALLDIELFHEIYRYKESLLNLRFIPQSHVNIHACERDGWMVSLSLKKVIIFDIVIVIYSNLRRDVAGYRPS